MLKKSLPQFVIIRFEKHSTNGLAWSKFQHSTTNIHIKIKFKSLSNSKTKRETFPQTQIEQQKKNKTRHNKL
jgi:hypothetical protein